MTHARTIWEEGRTPGERVVTLTVALVLTVACVELVLFDRLGIVFDLGFVIICAAAALSVRPQDFFTVGVLPPLAILGVFLLLALTDVDAIADHGDSTVQALATGLSRHGLALLLAYAATLGSLAMRRHVLGMHFDDASTAIAPARVPAARPDSDQESRRVAGASSDDHRLRL